VCDAAILFLTLLTEQGYRAASAIELDLTPDLIVVSPMQRTIETAFAAFPHLLHGEKPVPMEVWPDLREAHDAICNNGSPVVELKKLFPSLDFSECNLEWTYIQASQSCQG
jgi:broad specificity phosphatase PhoE